MGTAGGRSLPRGAARPDKTRDSHTSSGARRSWTRLPRRAGDIITSMPANRLLAKIFSLGRLCPKTFSLGRLCAKMFAIGFFCALLGLPALAQDAAWQRDLLAWRAQHVADLLKPNGWLSLVGLEWLQPGDNPFGSATDNKIHLPAGNPAHFGVLHLEGTAVTLNAPPGG